MMALFPTSLRRAALAAALPIAACAPAHAPVPPPVMPQSAPPPPSTEGRTPLSQVPILPAVPRWQSIEISRPTVYAPAPPAPTMPYVPPAGSSPVTGYGIGGMQLPPGAPPNPPYPAGGLLHP